MDPTYQVLVHYGSGVDPVAVARAVVAEWRHSARPELLHFAKSGPGAAPTDELLRKALTFTRQQEDVGITFKTSRARTGVDKVEFLFSNPAWNFSRPPNYVAVTFSHEMVDESRPGYTCKDLGDLIRALVAAGPAESAYAEKYDVVHAPRFREIRIAVNERLGVEPLHWISFVSAQLRRVLEGDRRRLPPGVEVLHEVNDGGVIVTTGERPPSNTERHVDRLVGLAELIMARKQGPDRKSQSPDRE